MFVYSAISCEEILVFPIFRACVSTWRYRDRRGGGPAVQRPAPLTPAEDPPLSPPSGPAVTPGRPRDGRAAPPTSKPPPPPPPPPAFVTAFSFVPAPLAPRLSTPPAQRVGMHVVDKTAPPADLY